MWCAIELTEAQILDVVQFFHRRSTTSLQRWCGAAGSRNSQAGRGSRGVGHGQIGSMTARRAALVASIGEKDTLLIPTRLPERSLTE